MPFQDRRAAGRRPRLGTRTDHLEAGIARASGLDGRHCHRQLHTARPRQLRGTTVSSSVSDWNNSVEVEGRVTNQGSTTESSSFQVAIYASPVRGIDKYSVPIGEVTIPAGLAPGQTVPYQTSVTLPASPIPNVSSTGGTLLHRGLGST